MTAANVDCVDSPRRVGRGVVPRLVKALSALAAVATLSWAALYLHARRQEMHCRNELAGTGVQVEVRPIGPAWMSGILDHRFFETVVEVRYSRLRFDDVVLKQLECFPNLESLVFFETSLGDQGLGHLRQARQLRRLNLMATEVTPVGLLQLRDLPLEELRIGPYWDNDSLLAVSQLASLKSLTIQGCADVSDEGLEHLKRLENLEMLRLEFTGVSERGVQMFQQAMPGVQVVHSNSVAPRS